MNNSKPEYLRMLVDIKGGNMNEAARCLGLTESTVSSALSLNEVPQVIELAARGLVDRHTCNDQK